MNRQNLLSIAGNLVQPQINPGLVLLSARELDKMRRVGRLAANLLNKKAEGRGQKAEGFILMPKARSFWRPGGSRGLSPPVKSLIHRNLFNGGPNPPLNSSLLPSAFCLLPFFVNHLESMVQPGVSTRALNDEAARWLQAHGAISATLGYAPPGYPPFTGSICTSINEVVCHGIPNPKQILKDGDIINIDVTPILDGYHGDTSKTFLVGDVSATARKLVEATQESMMRGIAEIKPGARIGDIGAAIQEYAEASGFSVVRDMVGLQRTQTKWTDLHLHNCLSL